MKYQKILLLLSLIVLITFLTSCGQYDNYCNVEKDCEEKILVHAHCIGFWNCIQNTCAWKCDEQIINESKKNVYEIGIPDDRHYDTNKTLNSNDNRSAVFFITDAVCKEYGGYWNECASSCRWKKDTFCIEVCEEICMCATEKNFTCPPDYECKIYDENIGECIRKK
jgi:hypothetical protein